MVHLPFIAGLLIASVLFALMEIQIEGQNGWATNLPTWRIEDRWAQIFYSGKPLAGLRWIFMVRPGLSDGTN